MARLKSILSKVGQREHGESLEYALIAGLIVVAAIAVLGTVGAKLLERWNATGPL